MYTKKIIVIIVLVLLGIASTQAKSCKSCCPKVHCSEKEQNRLKKLVQEQQKQIDMLKSKIIHLDPGQMLTVNDDNNNFIGNVVDKYNPNLIGKNMRIVPRIALSKNSTLFYIDENMKGVFISLEHGRYTSQQISIPRNSISSISIPDHLEVVLYRHDN